MGYASSRDLAGALRAAGGVVVRRLPALHVAEVRAPEPARAAALLRRAPGIRSSSGRRRATRSSSGRVAAAVDRAQAVAAAALGLRRLR